MAAPSLDLTLGVVEVGVLLSIFLYGITTIQAFMYIQATYKDPLLLRLLVAFVWTFETIHTIFLCVLLYSLTVTHYAQPSALSEAPWTLDVSTTLSSFIGASVQAFFAYRIWVLSESLIIPVISWCGSIVRCGFGIAIGIEGVRSKTVPRFLDDFQWLVTANLVLCATIDVWNTSALCFYLLRRRSGVKNTDKLLDQLVLWTVETGLITSLCAVAMVICSLAMRTNLVWIGILMFYAKLFSNSLLTSLNARQSLRQHRVAVTTTSHNWSPMPLASHSTAADDKTVALKLSRLRPISVSPESSHRPFDSDTMAGKDLMEA